MAVVNLEDGGGTLETVVFPEAYSKYGAWLDTDKLVVVRGKFERDDESVRLIATEVRPIEAVLGEIGRPIAIQLAAPPADRATLEALADVLSRHQGNGRVALDLELRGRVPPIRVRAQLVATRVRPSERLIEEIETLCGKGAVSWN